MAHRDVVNLVGLCERGKESEFADYVRGLSDPTTVLNTVTPGAFGFTFLHIACDVGLPEIVSILLNRKVLVLCPLSATLALLPLPSCFSSSDVCLQLVIY